MKDFQIVVVGGGLAAARTVRAYREAGGSGRLALVGHEETLPYHRPPLSKGYLRGETDETPHVEKPAFYRDNEIEVLLGVAGTGLALDSRAVMLSDGTRLTFQKLVLATGASPRALPVSGGDLPGVYSLRTVADSGRIREAAREGASAVVVGGGFIGMEAAASLRQLGLAVTLVHRGSGLFDQLRSPRLGHELRELYRERGVTVLLHDEVLRFGGRRRLEWAETAGGGRIDADLAVAGVGVVPNVGFLEGSGLSLDNGVVVDERFESTLPGLYAVGDVANVLDPLYGRRRRIEHWSNADYQGKELGAILAGRPGGYAAVSSFFSEVFGRTLKVFGDTSRFDELDEDGTLDDEFLATYATDGRLVGAISVGLSDEVEARIKTSIGERASASALRGELTVGNAR